MPLLRHRMRRNAPLMCGWMLAWAASVAAASPPDLGACINIEADADRDRWFTAQEALEYGFIDQIQQFAVGATGVGVK